MLGCDREKTTYLSIVLYRCGESEGVQFKSA